MKVSELGELGLIDVLAKLVSSSADSRKASWRQLILGIGDDAAAWRGDASVQLATVDSLTQNVHFTLDTVTWKELGWKALAINLSDIAAMGGVPAYALVALSLPESTEVEDVSDLYKGVIELAGQHGVAIIGGDTDCAPFVSITVTVLGSAKAGILTRSAAKPGDKVAVSGHLGGAAAGLKMLTDKLHFDGEVTSILRSAFLRPVPRVADGQALVQQGVKAAIDISDGLVSDLRHICRASGVSARVNVDRVPVHPVVKANFGEEAIEMALSGGEDYELLFTADQGLIEKVKKTVSCPITVIGEIQAGEAGGIKLVDANNKPFTLRRAGWEHFKEN